MKVKIEETEYEMIPIPPSMAHYNGKIGELSQQKNETLEDAQRIRKAIEEWLHVLFTECVKPLPTTRHSLEAWHKLIVVTEAAMDSARGFREQLIPGDLPEAGKTSGPSALQPDETAKGN